LTVEDLLTIIRDHRKKTGAPRSVRTRVLPKNPGAACRQIQKYKTEVTNQLAVWDSSLFDWVTREAAPEQLTDELLEQLEDTQAGISELDKSFKEVSEKLEKAINRVKRVSAFREEAKEEGGGTRKRRDVHEEEDVEREFDESDADVEIEPDEDEDVDVEAEEAAAEGHKGNDRPLSLAICRSVAGISRLPTHRPRDSGTTTTSICLSCETCQRWNHERFRPMFRPRPAAGPSHASPTNGLQ
jgi:hypothetical protein